MTRLTKQQSRLVEILKNGSHSYADLRWGMGFASRTIWSVIDRGAAILKDRVVSLASECPAQGADTRAKVYSISTRKVFVRGKGWRGKRTSHGERVIRGVSSTVENFDGCASVLVRTGTARVQGRDVNVTRYENGMWIVGKEVG